MSSKNKKDHVPFLRQSQGKRKGVGRMSALKKQTKQTKGILMPFVTIISCRGKKTLKPKLMQKWSLIQNQPQLKTIYKIGLRLYHTKKVNRSKTCSLEQNSKGSRAATAEPHRGVCVGLSTTFPLWNCFL